MHSARRPGAAMVVLGLLGLAASQARGDEVTLRDVALQFYHSYARKDLAAFLSLWAAKSPEVEPRREQAEAFFQKNPAISISNVTVQTVVVDGEKATVHVLVSMTAMSGLRVLYCVKEQGIWKIWREGSAEESLVDSLVAAETAPERAFLLRQAKELVTVELARAMLKRADVLRVKGSYALALSLIELARDVALELNARPETARALNNIGAIHYAQGDYEDALDSFEKSLAISEQLDDKAVLGRAHNNIAGIHFVQGNYSKMLEHLQKSLLISEQMGDALLVSASLNNIGLIYLWQGNYGRASEYFQKSLERARSSGDKSAISRPLNNIGTIHLAQGNQVQALGYFQESLKLKEAFGDKAGVAVAMTNIADVYAKQGDFPRALDYYGKALTLFKTIADKAGIANTLTHIGELHELRGKAVDALPNFQESLALFEALGDKLGIARARNNIGEVQFKRGKPDDALEYTAQASDIARQIGDRDRLWKSRTTAGKIHFALNQPQQAREAFAEAIESIEAMRDQVSGGEQERQGFFENKLGPYHGMIQLLAAHGTPSEVLAYAERAKARVLVDVLAGGRVNVTKAMTVQEREQEERLRGELIALNGRVYREKSDEIRRSDLQKRLEQARLAYQKFQTTLYAVHPDLKIRRGQVKPVSLDEAAELLPDADSALLEYEVTEQTTYLLVLTWSGGKLRLELYTLEINSTELKDQVQRFRQQVSQRDLGFGQVALGLYDVLLKPAQQQLHGKRSLIIVPDGPLWELPFQALQPRANRYLLEDCAVSYAPSVAVLSEMRRLHKRSDKKPSAARTLWATGNPILPAQFEPLPETERQVRLLAQLYGAGRSKVYVRAEAHEERFKAEAGGYKVVHLATHGVLNDTSPMYSHVVFSQKDRNAKEDGLLEAWELMEMELSADLVILSACETARGRVGLGEGIIGTSWALFVAGTPTAVVSQWKVESASTSRLMLDFHRKLRAGAPPAKALWLAALKLLRSNSYRHPFYWAPFVVTGDGF